MTTEPPPADASLKAWFNEARYREFARELVALSPRFQAATFLALTLEGLGGRELMDRLRQTAIAFDAAQPGAFRPKVRLLQRLAPRIGHNFVAIWLCDYVARFGANDAAFALEALRTFTRFGSAEFAVRGFLERDLDGTLATMQQWAKDPNEHVRRLASEGSRPRLPWGLRVGALIRTPGLTWPILDALKHDPSEYVRRSVANHLNDLSKDHPEWVLDRLEEWDQSTAESQALVRHALRTLIKRGHPRALRLLGADPAAVRQLEVQSFQVSPRRVRLGETIELTAALRSRRGPALRLVVDYRVHYARPGGKKAVKVFKWAVVDLAGGSSVELRKAQRIKDFSTRTHHAGEHLVELQLNGVCLGQAKFTLVPSDPRNPRLHRRSGQP